MFCLGDSELEDQSIPQELLQCLVYYSHTLTRLEHPIIADCSILQYIVIYQNIL